MREEVYFTSAKTTLPQFPDCQGHRLLFLQELYLLGFYNLFHDLLVYLFLNSRIQCFWYLLSIPVGHRPLLYTWYLRGWRAGCAGSHICASGHLNAHLQCSTMVTTLLPYTSPSGKVAPGDKGYLQHKRPWKNSPHCFYVDWDGCRRSQPIKTCHLHIYKRTVLCLQRRYYWPWRIYRITLQVSLPGYLHTLLIDLYQKHLSQKDLDGTNEMKWGLAIVVLLLDYSWSKQSGLH